MSAVKDFEELVNSNPELQKKIEDALANYSGEQNEEAVFNNVISPIAAEAGFSFSFEDVKQEVEKAMSAEGMQSLNMDELAQVAGGDDRVGAGSTECLGVGAGLGVVIQTSKGRFSTCAIFGIGNAKGICFSSGVRDFQGSEDPVEIPEKLIKRDGGPMFMKDIQ